MKINIISLLFFFNWSLKSAPIIYQLLQTSVKSDLLKHAVEHDKNVKFFRFYVHIFCTFTQVKFQKKYFYSSTFQRSSDTDSCSKSPLVTHVRPLSREQTLAREFLVSPTTSRLWDRAAILSRRGGEEQQQADMADYSNVAPPSSNAGGGMNDAFKDALQRARQVRRRLRNHSG